MQRQVPIREVNQHLSRYIEIVEQGEEIIITRRGRPVARLSAVKTERELSEAQKDALARTLSRMREGYDLGEWAFDRDELHER
jgi:prevent-host-death family protein